MPIGRSDRLRVGEPVLAIGNPLGLGHTVTQGIVSATGRGRLGVATFENFIQTDAAINFGNSGGALVDASGKLVGLNSVIAGRQAGIEGIGFAIPVDLVRGVVDAIMRDGRSCAAGSASCRGDLNPGERRSSACPRARCWCARFIRTARPRRRASRGDFITEVNGTAVRGAQDLLARVAMLKPGQGVRLGLLRGAPGRGRRARNTRCALRSSSARRKRRHALVVGGDAPLHAAAGWRHRVVAARHAA